MKHFSNKNKQYLVTALVLVLVSGFTLKEKPVWGFFGHKRINRLAVFTLPTEMIGFYKRNIEFITEHAVDPDKRRYSAKHEAVRHYIDLDLYGTVPFDNVPRDWVSTLALYTDIYLTNEKQDTFHLIGLNKRRDVKDSIRIRIHRKDSLAIHKRDYRDFVFNNILPKYYNDTWDVSMDSLEQLITSKHLKRYTHAFGVDRFSENGIIPYYLLTMQRRLTRAFEERDERKILRMSTEMGHYIGDAHVPLHTTVNYDGQLTGQKGLHAFWESRIPELFADESYDYFVGKAEYIDNPKDRFWEIVLESHSHVKDVLRLEKELSKTTPESDQYCFEERNGGATKLPCTDYAYAYQESMEGLVESRMRSAIKTTGDVWYTAWVDGGSPNLNDLKHSELSEAERKELEEQDKLYRAGKILGRAHGH